MTRKLILVLAALTMLAFAVGVAVAAEPPQKITIEKVKEKKGGVTFDHKKHSVDFKCVECHHEAKTPEAEKAIKSCFSCHGVDPKAKGDVKSGKKDNPFHKGCVDCHKEKAKGPTKCKECHGGADE